MGKNAGGVRRRRIVSYGPADGATVPELPEDCLILHGGADILPDASIVCPIFFHPMLAAPKRKISGVRGQSPCHHTRRRSRPGVLINAESAAIRPAAIPSRATRRVANRQMPQACPPRRGIDKPKMPG